jgi:transcriptional regulator with XRE-family HTH domain
MSMDFADRLRQLLADRRMSQVELAKRLGVTHSAVTMVVNRKMKLPAARLEEVMDVLSVGGRDRPALRALYLASVAPKAVQREGADMLHAYEVLRERADLGDTLLAADAAFDGLPAGRALSARKGFYAPIVDALASLGAFSRNARGELRAQLEAARSPADAARVVTAIAIGLVRLKPDATTTEQYAKLRGVLSPERVQEILANAQRQAAR